MTKAKNTGKTPAIPKTPEQIQAEKDQAANGLPVTLNFFKPGDKQPDFPHVHPAWDKSDIVLLMRSDGSVLPGQVYLIKYDYNRGHISRKKGELLFNTLEDTAITDVVSWATLPAGK